MKEEVKNEKEQKTMAGGNPGSGFGRFPFGGGCGGGNSDSDATTAATEAVTTQAATSQAETAAPEAQETTAAAAESQAAEETQAAGAESDLAAQVRGNTDPSPELIEQVNSTLDDSYLGDFYGLGSDYSAYDGRFDGVSLDIWIPNTYGVATIYPDLGEHPVFKQIEELTGIDLNFTVPMTGEEKTEFNLMITGQELPDIIFNLGSYYNGGLVAAEEDGLILDLTEYEDKLPNYMTYVNNGAHSDYLKKDTVTDDHRRLAVYELLTNEAGISIGPLIKTKAMEDTGWTEVPETIEEWHTFLTDCKNAGYDAPLVFGNSAGFVMNGSGVFSSAFGIGSGMYIDDDGKVAWGPAQEGVKAYLETMSQWYQEGLLDPDYGVADSAHRIALTTSDDSAAVVNSPTSVIGYFGGDYKYGEDLVAAPFPVLNKGDQPVVDYSTNYRGTNTLAAVTTQCENVDAALAFLDFGFSKKGWELCGLGSYGNVHLVDEDGRPYYPEDSLIFTDEEIIQNGGSYSQSKYRLHHYVCAYSDEDSGPTTDKTALECKQMWTGESKSIGLPKISLTVEESNSIADITTNLSTAKDEYLTMIITGQLPLSEVDAFWEEAKGMGLDTYLSVEQAAYDRYLTR